MVGWDWMGWDGYLLGPTLRAPYGANKFSLALVATNVNESGLLVTSSKCEN